MPSSSGTLRHTPARLLSIAVAASALLAASLPPSSGSQLTPEHEAWREQVEPILTAEERSAFDSLTRDYLRDAFIDRFWTERGDFLDTWTQRSRIARHQFGSLTCDRARTLLQIGPPEFILSDLCPEVIHPLEAWHYPPTETHSSGFYLVFVRTGEGSDAAYRHWSTDLGLDAILLEPGVDTSPLAHCARRREWAMVIAETVAWSDLAAEEELLPPIPAPWVGDFLDRTTTIEPDAPKLVAAMSLEFPGTVGERTVVQAEWKLSGADLQASPEEISRYQVQIDGEVLRRGSLIEQFRVRYETPVDAVVDDQVPVAVQRYLVPGNYRLLLRLEDLVSGAVYRNELDLRVPTAAAIVSTSDTPLAEANAVLNAGDHMLKIRPLADRLHTGRVRIEAEATGSGIAEVAFVLNGRPVMSKTRPPYSLEIDLGRAPRLHTLEAIARDSAGRELAHDRVPINGGPHRFAVRLVEPRQGSRYIQSLRAVAEVHLPADETLDRIEFFLNEDRIATLYQPPFAQPLRLPENQRITYVRAVAYLTDGNQTEDLVFVNAPDNLARLRINMIELYTTVSDRRGLPVTGLAREDFVVREESQVQEIRRFELVGDRSIHAGVIIDASTSMEEEIDIAIESASEFFSSVIRPRDRAAVFVFNNEPQLEVPFTNNLELLTRGLEDVQTEGETALYDTLVYSLYYFAGLRGKRALILISDGEDSHSRHTLEETMDFAQRSGVAIYPIALGLDRRQLDARGVLMRLARETGGRFFSIASARELEDIYLAIDRELRSQYLLVYQSTHEQGGEFRKVDVEVAGPGLKARTIPGYYP